MLSKYSIRIKSFVIAEKISQLGSQSVEEFSLNVIRFRKAGMKMSPVLPLTFLAVVSLTGAACGDVAGWFYIAIGAPR